MGEGVPEEGQSGQTQRSGVNGLCDTWGLWTMSIGVEDNECPNQGRDGLLLSEKRRVTKGDDRNLWKG
jgi:hypothetical protein